MSVLVECRPVECCDLHVRYGKIVALDGVSISVPDGSVYALLGRNGAGKSSLVRCLLGLQKPDQGEARLFGEEVWPNRAKLMNRVGVVPEEPDMPTGMNARQLASFCAGIYHKWDGPAVAERLKRFEVPMNTPAGRLSKGQKAQLSLVLALGSKPELLVMDDPTLGLDAVARRELYQELLGELADRGTTVFITTHDLAGIEGIASRVGILCDGRMLLDEELEDIKARFRRIRVLDPESSQMVIDRCQVVQKMAIGAGSELIVSDHDETLPSKLNGSAEIEALSLEDIFLVVAGKEAQR
jgi:ABC-2 type transport system ATP-binding protein